jgi:hypothetical protein
MLVLVLIGVLSVLAPGASAHVVERSGPYRVSMGWGNEPALSGSENFVEIGLADASGAPVPAPAGALDVEVGFGGAVRTLALAPGEEPGTFRAVLVPTRPGTYRFHVTGTVRGRAVDARAACSERTFDCVVDAAGAQFPAREPSSGEVAEKLDRQLPRAQREAKETADDARRLALVALVVAVLAVAAAVVLGVRGRRTRP